MKKIILKIILILSFAPYVLCLLAGIYSMFSNGLFDFIFNISSGLQNFIGSILIMMLMLFYYPVIPPCLIYQLVYLSVFLMKKHNVSEKKIKIISGIITGVLVFSATLLYINIQY